ncbi:MAG: WapI family immunity protein [Acidimicrobiales bacterium]
MLLRGRQGTELGLTLVGYQFPDELVDPWESNTLLVEVRLLAPEGSWDVVDPCLTTWETAQVTRWLAAFASRADLVANRALGVQAPNVTLGGQAIAGEPDRVAIRACFALELRPPWLRGGTNLCVDVDVDRPQLATAARHLQADLARFPQRGDDPTL